MCTPPHAPWHTHACAAPGRAAREPADTLQNHPAYLLAGVLDPSQQKPIPRLLSHPREFTGLSAPHKSISSSVSSSSSPATSKDPASDRSKESDCFLSLPPWTGEVERRGKRARRSRAGTCLHPSGCSLVYYWFDTQLPQQPPERSPGQPDEMPGTGERLTATRAEEAGFSGLWELSPGVCHPTGRNHLPLLTFSFADPSLKRIARAAGKCARQGR